MFVRIEINVETDVETEVLRVIVLPVGSRVLGSKSDRFHYIDERSHVNNGIYSYIYQ